MSDDVWPPPPEDILQVLFDDLRDYEEQKTELTRVVAELTERNRNLSQRCQQYERQVTIYEKAMDHMIESQIRSRDW